MERQGYPTALTAAAWALLQPHLPPASPRGRPRVHSYRVLRTQGLVLRATVHEARIADRDGITLLPAEETEEQASIQQQFPRLAQLWLDGGYNGAGRGKDWVEQTLGWSVESVKHLPKPRGVWAREGEEIDWATILPPPGFRGVLPRRWVVERTLAWLGQHRRLSKDCERLCATGEALIYATMSRLMARRLARA